MCLQYFLVQYRPTCIRRCRLQISFFTIGAVSSPATNNQNTPGNVNQSSNALPPQKSKNYEDENTDCRILIDCKSTLIVTILCT